MTVSRLRRTARAARFAHLTRLTASGSESGFAMFIALLLIMIIGGISLLVAGLVLSQSKPTQTARKEVATVNAAEAGFELALHRLRSAVDTAPTPNGILSKLPCTAASSSAVTPFTGSVGPLSGAAKNQQLTYTVGIRYYLDDPSAMGDSDLNSSAVACSAGHPAITPQYAYLQANGSALGGANATGQSTQNNRALHTTYRFRTSNLNIAGGRLWMNNTGPGNTQTTALCMDAGTGTAGTAVTVTACQNRGVRYQQSWAYRADLTLYYTSSGTPGLCLTAGTTFGTAATAQLKLQTCATKGTGTTYPYAASPSLQQRQEWSFDDNGKFEAAATGGGLNGNCISTSTYASPAAGNILYAQGCSTGGFDTMTWNPDTQVGAGPAGDATDQLVNYAEFGRCLDITGTNVNATWLIDYPCKQAPDPNNITFNQTWTYTTSATATTTLYTNTGGTNYCLTAPTTQSATVANNLVLTKACVTNQATQTWTKRGEVVGNYGASYNIVSNLGGCLSLGPGLGDTYNQQWSSIITEPCDGSLKQKWNAPANFIDSRFKGTAEDAGGQ
jgi:Tfp pilus assembly protein PilX